MVSIDKIWPWNMDKPIQRNFKMFFFGLPYILLNFDRNCRSDLLWKTTNRQTGISSSLSKSSLWKLITYKSMPSDFFLSSFNQIFKNKIFLKLSFENIFSWQTKLICMFPLKSIECLWLYFFCKYYGTVPIVCFHLNLWIISEYMNS